jgi:hypothetical protein
VYLWRLGKEGDYRKIVRLQFQNTVMFWGTGVWKTEL